MAFGSIKVISRGAERTQKPPRTKPEKRVDTSVLAGMAVAAGALHMNVAIVAKSVQEAANYLCGLYFNTGAAMAGRTNACYTQDFATICRLAELKQELEYEVLQPVGSEISIRGPMEGETLAHCVLNMGQPGKQADSAELEFRWAATASAVAGADIAVVLVNLTEDNDALKKAAADLACPVVWVVWGFEQNALFEPEEADPGIEPTVLRLLTQNASIAGKQTDVLSFVQLYGGLRLLNRLDDGTANLETWRKCREYVPVGCHVGLMAAMLAALNRQERLAPAMELLKRDLGQILNTWKRWFIELGSEGGSEL